ESTGRGGDGAEFYSMRGFAVQPTMVNGMASITNAGLDPANIETIEIVKGPSGTLFGGNVISYGGLINVVTKKPHNQSRGEINFTNGGFGLRRITADYNLPLSKQLAIRVNAANSSEDSFQDAGFSKSTYIAPSLLFKASDKLQFLINSEMRFAESANAPMIFLSRYSPLSFQTMDLFEKSYRKSFTANSLSISNPSFGFQGQMLYTLSKQWKSQTILSSSNTTSDGYYHYLWDSANGSDFTRFISKRDGKTRASGIQQNFNGDFLLGKLRNRLVIGLDYLEKTIDNSSSGWVAHGLVSLKNQKDDGKLTPQAVDQSLLNVFEGVSSVKTKISSVYASDVINLSKNLSAMLSLRLDHFEGQPNYYSTEKIKSQ
ncbi:MAG: TonB-dependent siderophore receptor, partial [Sphingobacteriia bacterium 35-40-5]